VLARRIGETPGAFKRAGQAAVVVGLDWPAVNVLLPQDGDRERLLALLQAWEGGMLAGAAKATEKTGGRGKSDPR
jgi:hypothetical protein